MASKRQATGVRGVYLVAAELGGLRAVLCAQFYPYDLQPRDASFRRVFSEFADIVGDMAAVGVASSVGLAV